MSKIPKNVVMSYVDVPYDHSGLFKFICLQRKNEIEMNKEMEKTRKVLSLIFCTLRFEMPFGVDKG